MTFRDATPEDVEIAVPLIYSSGPPSFEYVFKMSDTKDASAFLQFVFVKPGGEFSYTNHICMVNEQNKIIGIGSHFDEKAVKGFTLNAVQNILLFYGFINGIKVLKRGLETEKIIPPPIGDTEVLAHLAILPSHQNKGLGSILIQHLSQLAKQKGKSTVSLDVSDENQRAKRLYERVGFTIKKKTTSTLKNKFSYVADHYKMYRDI